MKFCDPHWQALREGVDRRDLSQFVAASGEEVAENAVLELRGHGETFDPLMGSFWRIANRCLGNLARSQGPGAALSAAGDPDWCPLCFVQQSWEWWDDPAQNTNMAPRPIDAADAQGWIDRTLDAALDYARAEGLFDRPKKLPGLS